MSLKDNFICAWEAFPSLIASGASLTNTINLAGLRLFAIAIPDGWTAADLTFQMSLDAGETWINLYDQNGVEVTVVANGSTYVSLDPVTFSPIQYLRVRSGSSTTPVAQTAERSLKLILREM